MNARHWVEPVTSHRQQRSQPPADSGFSIVELLIAAAILMLVLMLVNQMLIESQRTLIRTNEEIRASDSRFALALLRADLESAWRVQGMSFLWSSDDLVLLGFEGRQQQLRIGLVDSKLERRLFDTSSSEVRRRILLQDVEHWRWRALLPNLLELEIGIARARAPIGPAVLARRPLRRPAQSQIDRLRVNLRGGRPQP